MIVVQTGQPYIGRPLKYKKTHKKGDLKIMKDFFITVAFIVLAVIIINVFISGDNNTMKSEGDRIGDNVISNMKEIEKNGTIYTP